ncbi:MAG: hypothetical protein SFX74_08935 [Fimbriimonadaceae bacterium]|nr:hypothetical protein [Fimbriimonadaceae bacterium]
MDPRFFAVACACSLLASSAYSLPIQRDINRTNPRWDYNGRYLVGVSNFGATTVWSALDGRRLYRFVIRKYLVRAELSQPGELLITSYNVPYMADMYVPDERFEPMRVWDLRTGKEAMSIANASYGQFSNDGKLIFGLFYPPGSYYRRNKRITLSPELCAWNAQTGKRLFRLPLKGNPPPASEGYTMQQSGDGSALLLAYDQHLWVVNAKSGRLIRHVEIDLGGRDDLQFINAAATLVQQASVSAITTFALPTGRQIKQTRRPDARHNWQTAWFDDGNTFAAVHQQGYVFSNANGSPWREESDFGRPISLVADTKHNQLLINGLTEHPAHGPSRELVTAFDLDARKRSWQIPGTLCSIWNGRAVVQTYDRNRLETKISLVDLEDGTTLRTIALETYDHIFLPLARIRIRATSF